MKLSHVPFYCLVVFLFTPATLWGEDVSAPLQTAVDQAVQRVKPALVRIHVVTTSYREGRELKFQASGSGAIISPDGFVVTNHHVAGHAKQLMCTLADRSEIEAELIGTDPLTDIAVIKLRPRDNKAPFPYVSFGDSSRVQVGDQVMAMGSPLALSQSVTLGIVSNTEMVMPRQMGFGSFQLDGEDVGMLVRWIAHDAVIYPGNSGGPLVDLRGQIVGINEISFGLGGAIPGNLARQIANDLIKFGDVPRSWLGMSIQPLLKHEERDRGALIAGTIEGSPAEKAGIQSGDILLSLNGEKTLVRYDEELPELNRMIADLPVGSEAKCVLLRDGKEVTLTMTTTQREPRRPEQREFKEWGITGRNISYIMSKEMKRESTDGVVVTSVAPGGPAGDAKPSINRGDILVSVAGQPIKNLSELAAKTDDLMKDSHEPTPVLTTFERKAETYVTAVEVGIRELNDPGLEVKKAWLPVNTQVITRDIADLLGDNDLTGFRVTHVFRESTADKAGLKVGDLILAVDGQVLRASAPEHYEELPTLIRNYRVGTTVELSVQRDGDAMMIPVELIRAPKLDREMRKYRDENFEFTARDITFFDKAEEQWEESKSGVLVTEVKSGSWAELGMLRVGDLVQAVNGTPVGSVTELRDVMEGIADREEDAVVMKVLRGIYTVYVEMEPKWDEN